MIGMATGGRSVRDRLPHLFGVGVVPPDSLCEQLAQLVPIKNANTFRDAVPLLTAHDTIQQLIKKLEDRFLRFQSFQAPEKVIEAYRLIGQETIFDDVSNLWAGPNTTAEHIRRRLSGYVQRRNQIAHEGDLEANGQQRPMQPEYAIGCRDFISNLVVRLNNIVYGV